MHCWLFWRVLVSSIILIKFSECCAIETDRPVKEVLKKNEDSPWLVLIADKTVKLDEYGSVDGLSYGAVIQSNLILTSAAVSKRPVENLIVIANCVVERGLKCDTYPVAEMYFPPNSDANYINEGDPVILMVTTPLELSAKVSPVRLATSNDDFDPDNCVIHHWQPIVRHYWIRKKEISEGGILNAEFQVSLNSDRFGMSETEETKMIDDIDCFLEWCLNDKNRNSMQKIHYMGSPIVCKLRNADDQVIVGFSTYTYGVVVKRDGTGAVSVVNGTLVEFSSELDNFFDDIINRQPELQ